MSFFFFGCRSYCRAPADDDAEDAAEISADLGDRALSDAALMAPIAEEPYFNPCLEAVGGGAAEASESEEEPADPLGARLVDDQFAICPISGMSTLHGACPFAKPKAKAKDGGKKQKASIQLDFEWVDRKSESK
ncbi:unnamed protein product, partial [Polarella glacialis]